MEKKESRLRRAARTRARIKIQGVPRLCIHRTPRHIYAQVLDPAGAVVIASASTLDKTLREAIANGGNCAGAATVGKAVAERALAAGVKQVAFDRSGFKFHGRVKVLADAAREQGLQF
jgi:large subunit ribosomal protein L18